jgi:hypothetical protein
MHAALFTQALAIAFLAAGAIRSGEDSYCGVMSYSSRHGMSNSGLSNRCVRRLPKKMTLSAQPHF